MIDEILTELLAASDSKEATVIAKALIKKAKKGDGKIAQLVAERTQGKPTQAIRHTIGEDAAIIFDRLRSKSTEELDFIATHRREPRDAAELAQFLDRKQ